MPEKNEKESPKTTLYKLLMDSELRKRDPNTGYDDRIYWQGRADAYRVARTLLDGEDIRGGCNTKTSQYARQQPYDFKDALDEHHRVEEKDRDDLQKQLLILDGAEFEEEV